MRRLERIITENKNISDEIKNTYIKNLAFTDILLIISILTVTIGAALAHFYHIEWLMWLLQPVKGVV